MMVATEVDRTVARLDAKCKYKVKTYGGVILSVAGYAKWVRWWEQSNGGIRVESVALTQAMHSVGPRHGAGKNLANHGAGIGQKGD